MSDIAALITDNLDIWTSAIERKGGAGRGSSKKISLYGIDRLRALILDLAVRGKLVEQDSEDEPASELLKRLTKDRIDKKKRKSSTQKGSHSEAGSQELAFLLPAGWHWVIVSEVADVLRGVTYKKSDAQSHEESGLIGLLRGHNIQRDINLDDLVYVPEDKVSHDQILLEGDIVIAMSSGSADLVGKAAAFSANKLAYSFGAFCGVVRPIAADLFPFMNFYCATPFYRQQTQSGGKGIGIQNLSKGVLEGLSVALPPLAEQKRIVAKVDELMALCDELERESENALAAHQTLVETLLATLTTSTDAANLAKNWARLETHFDTLFTTQPSIDALKQTILDLAVRGKLVGQDTKDESPVQLLNEVKAEKLRLALGSRQRNGKSAGPIGLHEHPFQLPEGWSFVRFGDVVISRDAERVPISSDDRSRRQGVYDYYGASGVIDKIDDYLFDKPLLLIGEDGANLINRSTPIAFIAEGKYWVNNHAHVLDGVSLDHLRFMELSVNAIDLKPYVTGTAQPKMNQAKMNSIVVALPPVAEQKRIVAKVDKLMAVCEQLKSRLAGAAETQRHLADAITHQAAA